MSALASFKKVIENFQFVWCFLKFFSTILWRCNVSVKSKLQHPRPPLPAHSGHLTPLPSWGGGNLNIRVFQAVGNLNHSLDFMWNLWALCTWRATMVDTVLEDFHGKNCAFVVNWLPGKGLNKLFVHRIWRYLNFNIFKIGFRLWIYECKLCLQWEMSEEEATLMSCLLIFVTLVFSSFKIIPYLKSRLNDMLKISKCKRVCMENRGSGYR